LRRNSYLDQITHGTSRDDAYIQRESISYLA